MMCRGEVRGGKERRGEAAAEEPEGEVEKRAKESCRASSSSKPPPASSLHHLLLQVQVHE